MNKWVLGLEIENIVNPPAEQKTLNLIKMPSTPVDVYVFFQFLRDNISLESAGMDSVKLRESKSSIKSLLKEDGYSWKHYKGFVDRFEQDLLQDHYEKMEKIREKDK